MSALETLLDALAAALRRAADYNRNDQTPPAAVLWTDRERQWSALLSRLRQRLPIATLGPYDPAAQTGPAYWIRFALGVGEIGGEGPRAVPIVYLPGVSRPELRAVEECPPELRPLAELQYRGVFWSHRNGKDWTVPAFLSSGDGGLSIAVAGDGATRDALLDVLPLVADLPLARLRREAPLRAEFFYAVADPDETRSILEWMDDPAAFRRTRDDGQWKIFVQTATRQYGFDPELVDPVAAAALLGGREGRWATVWERFRDVPQRYPSLPDLLRTARPAPGGQLALFGGAIAGSWPQENEEAESRLRADLLALEGISAGAARARLADLDADHGPRRGWVWTQLGQAPLAAALDHLRALAEATAKAPGGADAAVIGAAYAEWGWRADAAMLDALAAVARQDDQAAVAAAIRAVYRPWLDQAASALQTAWAESPPPRFASVTAGVAPGTCVLFADGLRFDLARQLEALLAPKANVALEWRFGPLPGVTPSAKPAVSPVADVLGPGPGFDATIAATGSKLTAEGFRKLLAAAGWQVLTGSQTGDPTGRAWTEAGEIDKYGHGHGWKLARHARDEVRAVARRAEELLEAGWERVIVVTDHGWLLLPGGLPKAELPEHLTELRKGRCARLKPNVQTDEQVVPWHWDAAVRVAVARGVAVYQTGAEYEHGGLSPQECVVPVLTASRSVPKGAAVIKDVSWRGLVCRVRVSGAPPGATADLRTRAGEAASSLLAAPKAISGEGAASLVVEDEEREGQAVHCVVCDEAGRVVAQTTTTVGG